MKRKVTTHELNNELLINKKNNINNIISIFPTEIVDKLTNIDNYKKLNWKTFPQPAKQKLISKEFTFCNSKDKRDIENGLALRLIKISDFLQYMINLHMQNDNKFMFNINSTVIRKILGKEYELILCLLHNLDIITRNGSYFAGSNKISYQYTINGKLLYTTDSYSCILIKDPRNPLNEKTTLFEKYEKKVVDITDERMIKTLSSITLDKKSALTYTFNVFFGSKQTKEDVNKLIHYVNYILAFGAKKYLKAGIRSKRIYSHLTYIPKSLEQFLNIDFYNVDLKNSQLLILCYFAKLNGLKLDKTFIEDCEQGNIYEQFLLVNNNERSKCKTSIFSEVLFDFKTRKNNHTNALFKKLYPQTWQVLKEIDNAKKENGTLASKLQSMEFDIFSTTPSVCTNSEHLYTKHDCIYFDNNDDKKLVTNHLKEKFKEMDLEVSFNFD